MSNYAQSNVGWYAVARDRGRTVMATGPYPAAEAHKRVDTDVRPAMRARGLPFATPGVMRVVARTAADLPVHTIPGKAA